MSDKAQERILELIKENDIHFIRLQFTDLLGNLKNVAITAEDIQNAFDNKIMFDGSSIDGFGRVEESDMYLRPDLDTFTLLPWRPSDGQVARMICDVYTPEGYPYESDPRHVLKEVLEEAEEEGYTFNVGAECEFFLFHLDDVGRPTIVTHDESSYFDLEPLDIAGDVRRKICLNLEKMNFKLETSHHEVASGQHEIDFKYEDALKTADNIMTFKLAVKAIAKQNGLYASFMPKPKEGINGSGMHINMSLMKDGRNIFYDPSDETGRGLSKEAYYFIAGILKHIKGMTAISNPLVNSYKRLVKGYEAPVHIAWSCRNRSPLIRIPASRGSGTRIELRSPDPAANPYLLLACCLKAGLEGLREKELPPDELSGNIYEIAKDLNIETLPRNLEIALEELQKDSVICDVLGDELLEKYINMKKNECDEYSHQVSPWEIKKYLSRY